MTAALRCSDGARDRGDPMLATAPPASRFLLVEVPGPWGHAALLESRLDRDVARELGARAAAAGIRLLLIRRPGRHADDGVAHGAGRPGARRLAAVADTRGPGGAVRWSDWSAPAELLDVDLTGPVSPAGPQRVALVCTHGRHDLCCAVRGRAVATELAARPAASPAGAEEGSGWDVWESSHLGGHRFAANLLAVPHGELFGGLDGADDASAVLADLDAGLLDLERYRGRCGTPQPEQAGVHLTMARLGERRRGAVRVLERLDAPDGVHRLVLGVGAGGDRVMVTVRESRREPAVVSCGAVTAEPVRAYALESLESLEPGDSA